NYVSHYSLRASRRLSRDLPTSLACLRRIPLLGRHRQQRCQPNLGIGRHRLRPHGAGRLRQRLLHRAASSSSASATRIASGTNGTPISPLPSSTSCAAPTSPTSSCATLTSLPCHRTC